jgi:multicomponent Na+:H+ antiporter subunit C
MTVYLLCFILFLVGLYGVLTKRDLIKIVLALTIMANAANLFLILFGYNANAGYPILSEGVVPGPMVDPLTQAMVLTAIVIELGATALLVAFVVRLFQKYKTFDITKIRRLSG